MTIRDNAYRQQPALFVLVGIIVIGIVTVTLRLMFSHTENVWRCEQGQWVRHGQPPSAQPSTPCGETPDTPINVNAEVVAVKKSALLRAHPELVGFEQSDTMAGHEVRVAQQGSDHYFAYLVLGSGVPIAQATCFRVDHALRVFTVGLYPDPTDVASSYTDVDPMTCQGRSLAPNS